MKKLLISLWLLANGITALAAPDPALVRQLADDDNSTKVEAIQGLARSADPEVAAILTAMADGNLYLAGDTVVIIEGDKAIEAATGKSMPVPPNADGQRIDA